MAITAPTRTLANYSPTAYSGTLTARRTPAETRQRERIYDPSLSAQTAAQQVADIKQYGNVQNLLKELPHLPGVSRSEQQLTQVAKPLADARTAAAEARAVIPFQDQLANLQNQMGQQWPQYIQSRDTLARRNEAGQQFQQGQQQDLLSLMFGLLGNIF